MELIFQTYSHQIHETHSYHCNLMSTFQQHHHRQQNLLELTEIDMKIKISAWLKVPQQMIEPSRLYLHNSRHDGCYHMLNHDQRQIDCHYIPHVIVQVYKCKNMQHVEQKKTQSKKPILQPLIVHQPLTICVTIPSTATTNVIVQPCLGLTNTDVLIPRHIILDRTLIQLG